MLTSKAGKKSKSRFSQRKAWIAALIVSDSLMIMLSLWLAYYARFGGRIIDLGSSPMPQETLFFYTRVIYIFTPLVLVTFFFYKLYDWDYLLGSSGEYTRVLSATTVGIFVVVLVSFMAKAPSISRAWLFIVWVAGCMFIISSRLLIRQAIYWQRRRKIFVIPTLIVGANQEGRDIANQITKTPNSGIRIVGFADDYLTDGEEVINGLKVVGKTVVLPSLIDADRVESVVFASSAFSHQQIVRMLQALRGYKIDIQLSSGLFEILLSRVMIKEIGGIPFVGIKSVSLSTGDLILKTAFDFTLALGALVLLSPLLLLIALLIKITSPGPVLYVQERVGKGGRVFNFYKFRTMRKGADKMLPELKSLNEKEEVIFKMKNDPRTTPIGRVLRRLSFDELPQFLNVIKGDMSLVGPRPPISEEVAEYQDWQLKRLDVIPGMTGLWQVSGRSSLSFEEMVKLDLFYIENWSLTFDIKILLKTVKAVIAGTGAY
jgi:exopolysaccharide biosynthesis polyprenyl glycosylphosphotransferase